MADFDSISSEKCSDRMSKVHPSPLLERERKCLSELWCLLKLWLLTLPQTFRFGRSRTGPRNRRLHKPIKWFSCRWFTDHIFEKKKKMHRKDTIEDHGSWMLWVLMTSIPHYQVKKCPLWLLTHLTQMNPCTYSKWYMKIVLWWRFIKRYVDKQTTPRAGS